MRSCTGSLTTAPTRPAATSSAPHHAVAEVGGQRQPVGHHRDRLGGRQRADGRLDGRAPVGGHPGAQLAEDRDDAADLGRAPRGRPAGESARPRAATRVRTISTSSLERVGQRQHDGVEAALQGGGQLVDALVAVVGGGDDVEAGLGLHLGVELGDGSVFSERIVMSASCTSAGMRVSSSMRAMRAGLHGPHHRARHQRRAASGPRRAAGRSSSRSAATPRRARGALHQQRRGAADRRGEVLAHPGLGGAGHAEQQQRPVGGQRGDGDLDEPPRADVLRRDRRCRRRASPPSR